MFIHKQNYELQCAVNCSEWRQCAYKVSMGGGKYEHKYYTASYSTGTTRVYRVNL